MGIYYSSYALLGYRIKVPEKTEERTSRGCSHPSAGENFCHVCGKPMWIKDSITLYSRYDVMDALRVELGVQKNLLILDEFHPMKDNGKFFIGFGGESDQTKQVRAVKPMTREEIDAAIKPALIAHGLWNDDVNASFGLWIIHDGR